MSKNCMSKAFFNLSIKHDISKAEFLFLNELKCVRNQQNLRSMLYVMLLTAERIFQFLFFELKKRKSSLTEDLLCSVQKPYTTKTTIRYGLLDMLSSKSRFIDS